MSEGEGQDWGGPYVIAAFFHRGRKRVAGGMTFESVYTEVPSPPPGASVAATLHVIAAPGRARGEIEAGYSVEGPSGLRTPIATISGAYVRGEDRLLSWTTDIAISGSAPGLHWIEVWLGDRLATKVPLLVLPPAATGIRPRTP